MSIEKVYDELSEEYLNIFKTPGMKRIMAMEQDLVVSHIPATEIRPQVLEIGTGPGRLSAEVHKKEVVFTGVDISSEMIRICRKNLVPEPGLIHLDVSNGLPFKDESFDYVYSLRVMKYVRNFQTVLKDVCRVLRPGGALFFNMPNIISVGALSTNQYGKGGLYTIDKTVSVLKKSGFGSIEVIGGPKLPNFLYRMGDDTMSASIIRIEKRLESLFTYRFTREPFYYCIKE